MIQRTQGNTQRIAIAVEKAELNKEGEIIRTPFEFEAGDRVAVTLYGKRKYIYTPELATGVAVVTLIGTEICDVYDMRVDITRADGTRNAYNSRAVLELVPEEAEQIRAERARVEREKLAQMDAEAMQADNTPAEQ